MVQEKVLVEVSETLQLFIDGELCEVHTWERLERIEICPGTTEAMFKLEGKAALHHNYKVCLLLNDRCIQVSKTIYSPKPKSDRCPIQIKCISDEFIQIDFISRSHQELQWNIIDPLGEISLSGKMNLRTPYTRIRRSKLPETYNIEWSSPYSFGILQD